MNDENHLLTVRFDGDAVKFGRIPLDFLLTFLTNMNKALQRTGHVLAGETQSVRRGRQPRSIKDDVALDLVFLTHGSPAVVLGIARRRADAPLPGMDPSVDILRKALTGLSEAQELGDELPSGCDAGVLMAWRDAGALFTKGITEIGFTLNDTIQPLKVALTAAGVTRIQERIKGPQTNIRTVEGRLLMADFKEHGTRCRVHPSVGEPVLCLFDEAQKDEVLDNILQFVRIVGESKQDAVTGRIASIKIRDIERLEDLGGVAAELLPQGTPISRSFWESLTLDELAQAQGVKPMMDISLLCGTWPGDLDDGFEKDIDELRHGHMRNGPQP